LAGKNVSEIIYFVSGGRKTLTQSISQFIAFLVPSLTLLELSPGHHIIQCHVTSANDPWMLLSLILIRGDRNTGKP